MGLGISILLLLAGSWATLNFNGFSAVVWAYKVVPIPQKAANNRHIVKKDLSKVLCTAVCPSNFNIRNYLFLVAFSAIGK
jgi:hypothetical protein